MSEKVFGGGKAQVIFNDGEPFVRIKDVENTLASTGVLLTALGQATGDPYTRGMADAMSLVGAEMADLRSYHLAAEASKSL